MSRKQRYMKTIKDYLPETEQHKAITVKLPASLLKQVKSINKREGLKLSAVVRACLAHFADEMNQKKSA